MRTAFMIAVLGACVVCAISGVLLIVHERLLAGLLCLASGYSVAFGLAVHFDESGGRRPSGDGRDDRRPTRDPE